MTKKRRKKKPTTRPEPLVWWDGQRVPITHIPPEFRPTLTYDERWIVSMYPKHVIEKTHPNLYRLLKTGKR